MRDRSRRESLDRLRELSGITSQSHRRLLQSLVKARGELDLSQSEWSPSERRKLLKWSESFEWLERGPDNAPTLSVAPDFFPFLAEALSNVPRRLKRSRSRPPETYKQHELEDLLSEMAQESPIRLLAEFSEDEQKLLLSAQNSGDSKGFVIEEWTNCPLEETRLGPVVRLINQDFSRRTAPKVAKWLPPNYQLLLGSLNALGLARRGELQFRIDGTLKKSIERQILGEREGLPLAFPVPEVPKVTLILAALERGKLIQRSGRRAEILEERPLQSSRDLLSLLHNFAGVLDLPSSHRAIEGICNESFRFLFERRSPLYLTEALDVGLNEWIEETEKYGPELEATPSWSVLDLKAACWPRLVPLANALGLIEVGLDHLGAPLALRPSGLVRSTFQDFSGNKASRQGRNIVLETDFFKLVEAALIAPVHGEEKSFLWRLGKSSEAAEQARDVLMAFDLEDDTMTWLRSLKTQVKARARRWYVLEIESAELADQVAESATLQEVILDRVTPTVFLLKNETCLTESVRRELAALGLDLDAR